MAIKNEIYPITIEERVEILLQANFWIMFASGRIHRFVHEYYDPSDVVIRSCSSEIILHKVILLGTLRFRCLRIHGQEVNVLVVEVIDPIVVWIFVIKFKKAMVLIHHARA